MEEKFVRILSARLRPLAKRLETLEQKIESLPKSLSEKDGSKAMETKAQDILDTTEELKEETKLLKKECDQMYDREKLSEERQNSFEIWPDCNSNTVLNETASCENDLVPDGTRNTLEPDDSPATLSRHGDRSFVDRATSPVKLMQSKFEVIQGTPTDYELEQLGSDIATYWKKLGRRLNVSDPKLEEIDQPQVNLSEKGYHMLKYWKQSKGYAATYQALSDALQHELVQRQDLAEKFCYIKGNEGVETQLDRVRIQSATVQQIVSDTTAGLEQRLEMLEEKNQSQAESITARATKRQEILATIIGYLKDIGNNVKGVEVELMELQRQLDQMNDREKMPEEHKKSYQKSSDCNNNTSLNKTASCQNELAADGTPNAIEPDDSPASLGRQADKRFVDGVISPVNLMQSKFEGMEVAETEIPETSNPQKESFENRDGTVKEMELLGKERDQMHDLKVSEEHNKLIENSLDCNNIAIPNETTCCVDIRLISPREEIIVVADRIPNEKNVSFLNEAISPVQLMQSDFEGMEVAETEILEANKPQREEFENKDDKVKEMELLGKERDQMQDLKMPEEHNKFIEKSSDSNNNAILNETTCCVGRLLISPQEEIAVAGDRITNKEDARSLHEEISPVRLMQSDFYEGNKNCLRCRQLGEELRNLNIKMEQLTTSKYSKEKQDWEEKETEKKKREAKLKETNAKIKTLENEKQSFKDENQHLREQINRLKERNKMLKEEKKELLTSNSDLKKKINEHGTSDYENLKAECDKFSSDIQRLRKEVEENQLKCGTLQEKIRKWRNAKSRVCLPSGKDFPSSNGVVSVLKKDVSAKLAATRSSDLVGEATDIFDHRNDRESGTNVKEDSWWCVDLGENRRLFITHCALRHGKKDGEAILKHWKIQGSIDGHLWTDLKRSIDTTDKVPFRDPHPYFTGRWIVHGEVGAFRYFRILQTGRNSSGKYGIYLSGVEFYGRLVMACLKPLQAMET